MSTYINLIEWMDGFGSIDEIDTDKIYDNDFIIDNIKSDDYETRILSFKKSIYEFYNYYISIGVPPPFNIERNEITSLLDDSKDEFKIIRFDNPNFNLKIFPNDFMYKEKDLNLFFSKRYKNIFKIRDALCLLDGDNSRAFELYCADILREQNFYIKTTKKSWDKGIDLYGHLDSFSNNPHFKNRRLIKVTPFLKDLQSKINYHPIYSNILIFVECKRRRKDIKLGTKDLNSIASNFSAENLIQRSMEFQIKDPDRYSNLNNWEKVKLIFTSTDFDVPSLKLKNRNNIIGRNGIQLSWDLIVLSSSINSKFDDCFDKNEDFNLNNFLEKYNGK